MSDIKKQALSYALIVLGRKRRTKSQLAQKLKERDYDIDIIKEVLEYCETRQYLNDEEFARFWIEDRIRLKPMGKWRLRQELRQKGIEESIIATMLEELLPPELELALAKGLLTERAGKVQRHNEFPKVFSFLVRRGFSQEQIFKAAQELGLSFCKDDQT